MTPKWLDRDEYPFFSRFLNINGNKLHYIDEGHGEVVLFVHGTPSWSFDFRHVIKILRPYYRCIAFDHIGFGLSDKPADYDYSTIRHSETLSQLVRNLKLENINLVVHDFGGPIGFNFAIENPQLVKRMIVMNSWMWSSEADPKFQRFSKILKSPMLPFLYRYLNFSPRFVLPSSFGDRKLSSKIRRHYTKPFRRPDERNGTVAFARSLVNDQKWFESLWLRKGVVDQKPILFIWGKDDKLISDEYLEKFMEGFSNSTVVKFAGCGHFPQEEEAERTGLSILSFLRQRSVENDRAIAVDKNTVAENEFE